MMGKEMCAIVNPLRRVTASCLTTSTRTPFWRSIASWSVHTNPPNCGSIKPFITSDFFTGRGASKISSSKYRGGGEAWSYSYLKSTNDFGPTEAAPGRMNGLLEVLRSTSSGSSSFAMFTASGCPVAASVTVLTIKI